MPIRRQTVSVEVRRIIDGDTVEIDQRNHRGWLRVRLFGIDAPEIDQPGGWDSASQLQELLDGDDRLLLETVAFDQYGRAVGILYWRRQGRRRSVNLGMVHSGHAFASTYHRSRATVERMGFYAAERNARRHRRGVWAEGSDPIRPWEHRRATRAGAPRRRRSSRRGCSLWIVAVALAALVLVAIFQRIE